MNFSKRLLIYVILLVTLNIFCFSFVNLLGWIFDLSNDLTGSDPPMIAPFLAGIIVALPIWVFTWRFAQRISISNPSESNSKLRNLYLNIVLGISIINISLFGYRFFVGFHQLFNEFRFGYIASLIVWLPIFIIHIRPAQKEWFSENARARIHELFLNITFLVSLILIFISGRQIILELLNYILRLIFPEDVLVGSNAFDYNSGDISRLIIGIGLWFYAWNLRIKKSDLDFRTVDISVISVSQIFILFVSLFVILGQFIELLLGLDNIQESFIGRFEFFPEVFSFSIMSILIWSYYSSSFIPIKSGMNFFNVSSSINKWIYRYSVRAIGVIFIIAGAVSGLSFLLGLPIQFSKPDLLIPDEMGWETGVISASISATIMGLLIFRYINYRIKKDISVEEQKIKVEKSYLYFVAILFLVVLVGALIAILTIFINNLLSGEIGLSTLNIIRWPLSFAVSSLFILILYRKNISTQFKASSVTSVKEYKVEIFDSGSLEKHKDQLSKVFKVKKWNSIENIGKFSIDKSQIENIPNELEKIGSNKDYLLIDLDEKNIWVYYYNN